ncbi:MAG TPA: DnaD domain protein [Clostridium perfringens]|nr:DnaD domain protein [Clostridium perfringens]
MALFRHVRTEFWKDAKVLEEMTPEDKLFFLYILTNGNTTQIGIYKIPKKQMAFELGYSVESINTLIDRFENHYKVIRYNPQTRELAIKRWGKYNLVKGGKPIIDCVKKEVTEVKDKSLLAYVAQYIHKEEIKKEFEKLIDDTHNDTYHDSLDSIYTIGGQKEKENKNKKENENEYETKYLPVGKFKKLYEENVGLVNSIVAQWLIELSEDIDYDLFKRAVEIATDRGKCNKGYINGIIKQWYDNNIRSYRDLLAHEKSITNRGDNHGKYSNKYRKDEYTLWDEEEDESLYRKPTPEQLEEARKCFEELRRE